MFSVSFCRSDVHCIVVVSVCLPLSCWSLVFLNFFLAIVSTDSFESKSSKKRHNHNNTEKSGAYFKSRTTLYRGFDGSKIVTGWSFICLACLKSEKAMRKNAINKRDRSDTTSKTASQVLLPHSLQGVTGSSEHPKKPPPK